MSALRWILVVFGLIVWGCGIWQFVAGEYVPGGALVIAGGLCLVVAASGGWSAFVEGLTNWLYLWR